MSEQYMIPDDEQLRWDQEDEILMRIMHENHAKLVAAEQEKLDIEIKCEAAKYQAHLKKVRHAYHNAARAAATLAGAAGVATGICLFAGNALGVLIAASSTWVLVNLTSTFDKKSRRKKENHHEL